MGHGLNDSRDMIYAATGGKPWHGLGVELPGVATAKEVLEACPSFAAHISKRPAQYNGQDVPGYYFTVRDDVTGPSAVLGIVRSEYQVLQNADMLHTVEHLCKEPNGPLFETAGILFGGTKAWVLAKFPEGMVLKGRNGKEDIVNEYLLISNTHDGTNLMCVQSTPIRVVCNNTLSMAFEYSNSNRTAHVRHSGDLTAKLDHTEQLLGIVHKDFEEAQELYKALINCELTTAKQTEVLQALVPGTSGKAESKRLKIEQLAAVGAGNADFEGTAWALYNGVTELTDHYALETSKKDNAQDIRVNSAWWGNSATYKSEALKTIANMCLN